MQNPSWRHMVLVALGLFLAAWPEGGNAEAAVPVDVCVQCHKGLPANLGKPAFLFDNDIHAQKGFTCVDCHGGDSTTPNMAQAMSREKGFIGKPKPAEIPVLCDKCHGNLAFMRKYNPSIEVGQFKAYKTSVHGQRLAKGDTKVATCASCHGAHGILPPSQAQSSVYPPNVAKTCAKCHANKEYMKEYKIPTNQYEEYLKSVHAEMLLIKRELSAPTCNDCHGNHGAYPPGVSSVADVCGQCHVNNLNYFAKSPHKKAYDKMGLPECVVCHSNHKVLRASLQMLGDKPPAICVSCHPPGSKGLQVAAQMRGMIEGLESDIQRTDFKLAEAEQLGMEVSDARYEMKGARAAFLSAKTKVHYFSVPKVKEEADKGKKVASGAMETALAAIHEFYARRRWVILPIVLTLFLAGMLFLKLRDVERRE